MRRLEEHCAALRAVSSLSTEWTATRRVDESSETGADQDKRTPGGNHGHSLIPKFKPCFRYLLRLSPVSEVKAPSTATWDLTTPSVRWR